MKEPTMKELDALTSPVIGAWEVIIELDNDKTWYSGLTRGDAKRLARLLKSNNPKARIRLKRKQEKESEHGNV